MTTITTEEMRFLDISKIKKIPDTDLVEVTFHGSPVLVIGRKHFVSKLEGHGGAGITYWRSDRSVNKQITYVARECRRQLCPKVL